MSASPIPSSTPSRLRKIESSATAGERAAARVVRQASPAEARPEVFMIIDSLQPQKPSVRYVNRVTR